MIYEYRCSLCDKVIDVEHTMDETQNPSEQTKQKLKCPGKGECEFIEEGEEELTDQITFVRVFSCSYLKFDALSKEDKQKVLKKRATEDFKKNIEERKRVMQGSALKQLRNIGSKK